MMTPVRCLALVVTFAVCQMCVAQNSADLPGSTPDPIRVTGQLRAIKLLKVQSLDVPWSKSLTVRRIVEDLGGYPDFASYVVITMPSGERIRYPLDDLEKAEYRNMKLEPGSRLHIGTRD